MLYRLPAVRLCRAGFCRALCAVSACLASALKRPKKSPRAWQGVNLPPPRAFAFTDKREPLTQEKSPRMFQAVTRNPLGLITFAVKWEPLDFRERFKALTVAAQDLKARNILAFSAGGLALPHVSP
jgi:hypothetical protein